MFKDVYATTPCISYRVADAVTEIQRQVVMTSEQLSEVPLPGRDTGTVMDLYRLTPGLSKIAPFAHPLMVKDPVNNGRELTIIDVRNFTRLTRDQEVVVTGSMDYELACLRGYLQSVWFRGEYMDMVNLGSYPITIFSRWMSEVLTRRLALDPEIQMRVTVMSAYFYLCMHLDQEEDKLDERTMLRFATIIARCSYVNADEVIKIIEGFPYLRKAGDFCQLLETESKSARFERFNLAVLYTTISGSWFGSNARELIAVAVEHPPTWLAMVAMATNERGYRNTVIGKLCQLYQKADEVKSFIFNLKQLQN